MVAGYLPAIWLIRRLWNERDALQSTVLDMLKAKFADALNAKELWMEQSKTLEETGRLVASLEKKIGDLIEESRRVR